VRRRLAASFGCDPEEMAITRNASEALEAVQLGIPLERGDEVLTTTQDYPRMLTTWHQRERREGIVLREITFPVPPPSQEDLAERIERAITPQTKVIHVCHITDLTGQIFPIKRIVHRPRARGIEVRVHGAHGHAHLPLTRVALHCDYYATSLHKWPLAPPGARDLSGRTSGSSAPTTRRSRAASQVSRSTGWTRTSWSRTCGTRIGSSLRRSSTRSSAACG